MFEQGLDRVHARYPAMPREAVMRMRLLMHTLRALEGRLEALFAADDLTMSSWTVLMMLTASPTGELSPSHLSSVVVQSRTNMTRVADDLVKRGLVARRPSSQDRRRVALSLTTRGTRLVERLLPHTWSEYEHLLAPLGAIGQEALDSTLRALLQRIAEPVPAGGATRRAARKG